MGHGKLLQACAFSIYICLWINSTKQAWTAFIYHTIAFKLNWPTCCCGVMAVQVSKCVGPHGLLVGFHSSLAVNVQLEQSLATDKTHDLVTKEIQEMAYRVVTVFGIKTGTHSSLSV